MVSVKLKRILCWGGLLIMILWGMVIYLQYLVEAEDHLELISKKELILKERQVMARELKQLEKKISTKKIFQPVTIYQQLLLASQAAQLEVVGVTLANETEAAGESTPTLVLNLTGDFFALQELIQLIEAKADLQIQQLSIAAVDYGQASLSLELRISIIR